MEGTVVGGHCYQCCPSDLAECYGCLDVPGIERIFYGHLIRFVFLDKLLQVRFYFVYSVMKKLPAGRLDNAMTQDRVRVVGVLNNSETCRLNTGIDSKNPHKFYFSARIFGNFLFIYIKVGPDILDVIMIFQLFHQPEELLGLFSLELDVILGDVTQVGSCQVYVVFL